MKIIGDDYAGGFSQGRTMRNCQTTLELKYVEQFVVHIDGEKSIVTVLKNLKGHRLIHQVTAQANSDALVVQCSFKNESNELAQVEMLSSFSIGNLSPFEKDDSPKNLLLHRIRSTWAIEGKLESRHVEEFQLETSWAHWGVNNIRYGQVGTMPVREFFFHLLALKIKSITCVLGLYWHMVVLGKWRLIEEMRHYASLVALQTGNLVTGQKMFCQVKHCQRQELSYCCGW